VAHLLPAVNPVASAYAARTNAGTEDVVVSASPSAAAAAGGAGHGLREARLRQGLSLRGLARLLEVSPATLSAVENGRRNLAPARLARAAELLATTEDQLRPTAGNAPLRDVRPGRSGVLSPAPARPARPVSEDWRRFEPLQLDPPLTAALDAFLEFGYHGATMREIARRAGLSVPGVYHYYDSKQDMLVAVLDITMADLFARTTAARAEGRDPVERFALLIECLALYHTHRRELGFVGASEMRSLVPGQRARVAAARRAQQRMVDEEVEQACRAGGFEVQRPHEASRAVVTMSTALPQWFDGKGPATPEQVAAQYVEFALDLMRCTARARRRVLSGLESRHP
jgi:AcrR family transcriptional regulator/transcriptional regulator with XRE-family HTH domain